MTDCKALRDLIGKNVVIRTVTHYHLGRLVEITDGCFVLEEAWWVASTGLWSECLHYGAFDELESFPLSTPAIVSRGAMVDMCEWIHELPKRDGCRAGRVPKERMKFDAPIAKLKLEPPTSY